MKTKTRSQRLLGLTLTIFVTVLVVAGIVWAEGPNSTRSQRQRFEWILTDRLNVANRAIFSGDVDVAGDLEFSGDLVVEGDSDLYGEITSSEAAITLTDLVHITGARDGTTGYDYFLTIEGNLDGLVNGAKTYGQYINVERPLGSSVQHGNIDDAGLKIRIETNAITTTAGHVLNGMDVQAKTDNNAMQSTLRGAQITADTDASSYTDYAYGLRVYVEGEGMITTTMQVADFELSRQQATDPTNEYGLNIRNTSRAGGGADVALRVESSYGAGGGATDDDWEVLIDLEPADATVADIRLSQGELIDNSEVDGRIDVTGDISVTGVLTTTGSVYLQTWLYTEPVVTLDITNTNVITPTGTYQPLTVDGVGTATTGNPSISDGNHPGQILILVNEDDQDIVIVDAQNTKSGGNITLTANNDDSVMYIWDGTDWICLGFHDN